MFDIILKNLRSFTLDLSIHFQMCISKLNFSSQLTRRLKEMPARLLEVENEIKKYSECQHKVTTLLPLHESIIKTKTEEVPQLR